MPTTYLCGVNCPANPGAWQLHGAFHKKLRKRLKEQECDGEMQQQNREAAERAARIATQTGDAFSELMAEGMLYHSKQDWRKAARTYREAIALRPDRPEAYMNLGAVLDNSGHLVEAAQRFLEAKERYPVGSDWAEATALVFDMLRLKECAEVAKPEWWNEEGLKVLSAMVVGVAPNDALANSMRGTVLGGGFGAWEAGPRSAAELKEAATHYERAAALTSSAPTVKANFVRTAVACRTCAEAM
eukprot:scaffold121253_cov60-Phaeocystis_antarctica.AAC.1